MKSTMTKYITQTDVQSPLSSVWSTYNVVWKNSH